MFVATGEMDYTAAVLRARDVDELTGPERARLLERLVARYPEAVAAVLEDLRLPSGEELLIRRARSQLRREPGC